MKVSKVTIVMYHYVRDLKHSRYPEIKGLDLALFLEQIDYLQKHYHFVSMEDVIAACQACASLPSKAVLLTFDDAYADHFTNVFPILDERKIRGAFFPPVRAVTEHCVLDVNKVHFILASVPDKNVLVEDILAQLDAYRSQYHLDSNDYYLAKLSVANRFDPKEVIFIKRLLQVELAEELRAIITNSLFKKYVSKDEEAFSRELYMSMDQIRCLQRNGMHVGSHAYNHYWMGSLSKEKQEKEIDHSIEFIREIGGDVNNWTICYPFGNFNEDTLELLAGKGCKVGLTVEVAVADLAAHRSFQLPRLDTNDLPKERNAAPDDWYQKG